MPKFTPLDDRLYDYMLAHRSREDPILAELRSETRETLGRLAIMQVAPEQGAFLELLVAATGASQVVEVGTFTGYSARCMARALPPGGRLLCCDVSEEWTAIARRYWQKAGVADRVELRLGPAAETLRGLPEGEWVDLAFIDADKTEYEVYYELILPRIRPNGVVLFDNMFWGGLVLEGLSDHPSARAVRELIAKLASDDRVECVLLPIADGIQLCRKR